MFRILGPALVCLLLAVTAARGAAPPTTHMRLSPRQKQLMDEAGKNWKKAREAVRDGKPERAIAPGRVAVNAIRELAGVHPHLAAMLSTLADWCEMAKRFDPAVEARAEALAILKKLHGSDDWRVIDARLALAETRAWPKRDAADRDRLARADRRHRSAMTSAREGDLTTAAEGLASALTLTRQVRGDWCPQTAARMSNLAGILRDLGEYKRSEALLRRALAIRERTLGRRHPESASSLHALAALYWSLRDFRRAEPLFLSALRVQKDLLGENDQDTARTMANLAQLYKDDGRLTLARPLAERALAIRKEVVGESDPDYAMSLHNLGALYRDLGDLTGARLLYEKSLALRRKHLPRNHPDIAFSLNNLGDLHYRMENPKQAKKYFEQALEMLERQVGARHPLYQATLNNLAGVFIDEEDYPRALKLNEQALALARAALGERHPDTIRTLNNLGVVYWAKGDLARSLPIFERALALNKVALGERHPGYARSLDNLAVQHLSRGDPVRAEPLFRQALTLIRQHLDDTFSVQSARQRLGLLSLQQRYLHLYLTAASAADIEPARMYEHVLAWKGALAQRQTEERILAEQPELAPLAAELRAARVQLAQLGAVAPPPGSEKAWVNAFIRLEKEKEALEEKLASQSALFRRSRKKRKVSAEEILKALPSGVALVELVEYAQGLPRPVRKGQYQSEGRFLAFVLVRGRPVRCVALGPGERIHHAVVKWRRPLETSPPALPDPVAASDLRRWVWLPLARSLGEGITTVLVAPDGALAGLPLAALPGSRRGQYLLEEITLGVVPSGRSLLDSPEGGNSSPAEGLLVVGGLTYGKIGQPWPALPGTRLEVERIARLYRERFSDRSAPRLLTGRNAGKEALARELGGGKASAWRHLHLATHGFFAAPRREERDSAARAMMQQETAYLRNPLLACGLVLSDANSDPQKGILTGEEVMSLDLRRCDLVVLSACETGLGRVAEGEGVLGLQRAFHLAGAKTVVTSLWSVSDPATSVLMEQFYKCLWGEKKVSKLEALRQAQLFVLKNPDAVRKRAGELQAAAVRSGVASGLRGAGKKALLLPMSGKMASERSHPAWWAAFVPSVAGRW
jgi:CHAT domain-containing protein/Tfp pilus assembly protein PilF